MYWLMKLLRFLCKRLRQKNNAIGSVLINSTKSGAQRALMCSIFETIYAFLNTKGGTILIEVNDKGELVGRAELVCAKLTLLA